MGTAIDGLTGSSKALLMGRRTYELFALRLVRATEADDPGAPAVHLAYAPSV